MSRNPAIKKAYEDGLKNGYELGLKHGENKGIRKTVNYIAEKFAELPDIPGLGSKTLEKIRKQFGEEFFYD